jgi:hypothetical protein
MVTEEEVARWRGRVLEVKDTIQAVRNCEALRGEENKEWHERLSKADLELTNLLRWLQTLLPKTP